VRIALGLTVTALAFAACGETRQVEREPGLSTRAPSSGTDESAPNALIFRRADGSEIEMQGKPLVWCGPWNDEIPDQAIQVAAIGDVQRKPGQEFFSYWQLWAIPGDVQAGSAVRFPGDYTFDDPRGVVLFVGDTETENESSTEGEDSHGRIVFSHASCDVGDPVEFTIDAVIDSEFFDGKPITARGTFRGVVGDPPAGLYD
jgi:hypothetical protein